MEKIEKKERKEESMKKERERNRLHWLLLLQALVRNHSFHYSPECSHNGVCATANKATTAGWLEKINPISGTGTEAGLEVDGVK